MSAGAAIGAPAAPCSVVHAATLVVAGALQSEGARKTVRIRARSASACVTPAVPIAAEIGRPGRRAVATSRAMRVFMVRAFRQAAPTWIARHAASRAHQKVVLFYNWQFRRSMDARRDSSLEFRGVRAGAVGCPCDAGELDRRRQ